MKIKLIAATDNKRGIANTQGIPWDLSMDRRYFRQKTDGSTVIMGYNTYKEFDKPLPNRRNLVATSPDTELRDGFEAVGNIKAFIKNRNQSIWVIGGAKLFEETLHLADELYLTKIDRDFRCTKRFPEYKKFFRRKHQSADHHQNGLTFRFEVWERLSLNHPNAPKV